MVTSSETQLHSTLGLTRHFNIDTGDILLLDEAYDAADVHGKIPSKACSRLAGDWRLG